MDKKEQDTKNIISILYDMELNNYKMTRTIQRLNYEISRLGKPKKFEVPKEPSYPELMSEPNGCLAPIIGAVVGVVLGLFVAVVSENILWGLFFTMFLGPLMCGGFACLIESSIKDAKRSDRENELYQEYLRSYEKNKCIYSNAIEQDAIRVKKELDQKLILEAERNSLNEHKQKSEKILAEFYMRMNINVMFRNIVPIAKMYEIVDLGITYELQGENGLYDRVRQELKEDAFYAKLEEISQKLDTIISKQDRIYGEIIRINSQCENLINATMQSAKIAVDNNKLLSKAVENTQIAAYNSERIAAEERYQSFMLTYKF